jgi:hypothetical protein
LVGLLAQNLQSSFIGGRYGISCSGSTVTNLIIKPKTTKWVSLKFFVEEDDIPIDLLTKFQPDPVCNLRETTKTPVRYEICRAISGVALRNLQSCYTGSATKSAELFYKGRYRIGYQMRYRMALRIGHRSQRACGSKGDGDTSLRILITLSIIVGGRLMKIILTLAIPAFEIFKQQPSDFSYLTKS